MNMPGLNFQLGEDIDALRDAGRFVLDQVDQHISGKTRMI